MLVGLIYQHPMPTYSDSMTKAGGKATMDAGILQPVHGGVADHPTRLHSVGVTETKRGFLRFA